MNGFNLATDVKNALENWGAPNGQEKFHKADRVVMFSLITIAASTAIPTQLEFFKSGVQNATLSSDTFPLNGKAVDIIGLRIDHCIKLTLSDAGLANEQQQAFENTSRLQINYRNRRNIFDAPLSELVNYMSYVDGNDVVAMPRPGITSFLMLKEPIRYGATQPIDFILVNASGQTTEATSASSTPSLPGSVGSNYWIKLSLLTSQYTSI